MPELDAIIVPVSGGGMLSGIALAAKALKPSILIVAAEPCGSNDAADVAASKAAGRRVGDMTKPVTIAGVWCVNLPHSKRTSTPQIMLWR